MKVTYKVREYKRSVLPNRVELKKVREEKETENNKNRNRCL